MITGRIAVVVITSTEFISYHITSDVFYCPVYVDLDCATRIAVVS